MSTSLGSAADLKGSSNGGATSTGRSNIPASGSEVRRRIAVLGSRSVGKSTMIVRFMENVFVDSYYPTIEATFNKIIKHKGKMYSCDIIDTAGQVRLILRDRSYGQ
jgi:GTPase SAR1 family protein